MAKKKLNKVYIVSGPAGVGKSTTSKALAKTLKNCAYISGDYISHMHINGRKAPWESQKETFLIWDNILSLTENFLRYNNDVIVDYVTFPQEAEWFNNNLKKINVDVYYIILWTTQELLISRDQMRIPKHQMGDRCLVLVEQFLNSGLDERHILDTSNKTTAYIVKELMNNLKYNMT